MEAKVWHLAQQPTWLTSMLAMLSFWLSSWAFLTTKRKEELFESKGESSSDRSELPRRTSWIERRMNSDRRWTGMPRACRQLSTETMAKAEHLTSCTTSSFVRLLAKDQQQQLRNEPIISQSIYDFHIQLNHILLYRN